MFSKHNYCRKISTC